jgi:hypothetical protein
MNHYGLQITVEKKRTDTIDLKDLPVNGCFRDQYGQILMKLAYNIEADVLKSQSVQAPNYNNVWCVMLTAVQQSKVGTIIPYNINTTITPVESKLEIKVP